MMWLDQTWFGTQKGALSLYLERRETLGSFTAGLWPSSEPLETEDTQQGSLREVHRCQQTKPVNSDLALSEEPPWTKNGQER